LVVLSKFFFQTTRPQFHTCFRKEKTRKEIVEKIQKINLFLLNISIFHPFVFLFPKDSRVVKSRYILLLRGGAKAVVKEQWLIRCRTHGSAKFALGSSSSGVAATISRAREQENGDRESTGPFHNQVMQFSEVKNGVDTLILQHHLVVLCIWHHRRGWQNWNLAAANVGKGRQMTCPKHGLFPVCGPRTTSVTIVRASTMNFFGWVRPNALHFSRKIT